MPAHQQMVWLRIVPSERTPAQMKLLNKFGLTLVALMSFRAAALEFDLTRYQRQPGLEARAEQDALVVEWQGEADAQLRVEFVIEGGAPTVRQLSLRGQARAWTALGRNLKPLFGVTTGIRRTNHGLPEENRWDVFWDVPLNHTNEVRRFVEISFPGLEMGIFSGRLQFTVYRGANLLRLEAIAKTEEPSVAYKYEAGLSGLSTVLLPRVVWRDVRHETQAANVAGQRAAETVILRARNRLAIAEGDGGSLGFLPPPHQFFFARELEVNLGYVWYRKEADTTFSMGIRHADREEGYNPAWINGVFALYNAPPGTWQRMAAYLYVSPGDARACRSLCRGQSRSSRVAPGTGRAGRDASGNERS